MDANFRGAAEAGDTNELYNSIRNNADVLKHFDEAEFTDTPLHIAAAIGHTDLAVALMYLKPSLARKLNQDILSPMHLALQNDHDETVLCLLAVDRDLVRVKGKDGYTPLHHVVKQGKLDLLAKFLMDCPDCVEDITIKSETALHIAAQYDNFEVLKILARWIQRTDIYGKVSRKHILDLKDRDGNTVLHIAAAKTQPRMIQLLFECDVDTKDLTVFNVLESQSRSDNRERSLKILRDFDQNGCRNPFKAALQESLGSKITWNERAISSLLNLLAERIGICTLLVVLALIESVSLVNLSAERISLLSLSAETINSLLVVFTLILTATFQATVVPPAVLLGDISRADTVAIVEATAKDKSSFRLFFNRNIIIIVCASFVAVSCLQIATRNDCGIRIMIFLLLSALISCLIPVEVPDHSPKFLASASGLVNEFTPLLLIIAMVVALEMARMLPHIITTCRRVKYFKKIFRDW